MPPRELRALFALGMLVGLLLGACSALLAAQDAYIAMLEARLGDHDHAAAWRVASGIPADAGASAVADPAPGRVTIPDTPPVVAEEGPHGSL